MKFNTYEIQYKRNLIHTKFNTLKTASFLRLEYSVTLKLNQGFRGRGRGDAILAIREAPRENLKTNLKR